jgi:hypothetical protein
LNGGNGFEPRTLVMAEKRTEFSELNYSGPASLEFPGLLVVILLNFFQRRRLSDIS